MTTDWIDILDEPLDASATNRVLDPAAGGVATFLGTTRSEVNEAGRSLVALDYEAYREMALKQMRDLAERARQRWPIIKLVLLHRVGRVALAEPSVLIAVSTPHRGEAFEACRFLIDTLKAEVAVWKKEIWADGTGSWIHPQTHPQKSRTS
jgi:molybdopterin synthase catalytic subunit